MRRLDSIHARDVMQADLVTLDPSTSVESAIQTLEEFGIGGAPVIDSSGRPIGIFSKSDVSRVEHVRTGRLEATSGSWELADTSSDSEADDDANEGLILNMEDYSPAVGGSGIVTDWMSPKVVTVLPDAPLKQVCRTMVAEHIHRVLVMEGRKLLGIVTSFDVVRCVAEKA
jgi:CBS domain-containing protein